MWVFYQNISERMSWTQNHHGVRPCKKILHDGGHVKQLLGKRESYKINTNSHLGITQGIERKQRWGPLGPFDEVSNLHPLQHCGVEQRQLARLITLRSVVRVHSPLPNQCFLYFYVFLHIYYKRQIWREKKKSIFSYIKPQIY